MTFRAISTVGHGPRFPACFAPRAASQRSPCFDELGICAHTLSLSFSHDITACAPLAGWRVCWHTYGKWGHCRGEDATARVATTSQDIAAT